MSTPQEDGPPEVRLVIRAALDLAEIVEERDRPAADTIRGIDALGRALVDLKELLRRTG